MDLLQTSQEWSKSQFAVNDLLSALLNEIRDQGYNPSHHISYDHKESHIVVDKELLTKHASIQECFTKYVEACSQRDAALESIQGLDKVDLGF